MRGQLLDHEPWQLHPSPCGSRLEWSDAELAVDLDYLTLNRDGAPERIDIADLEPGQLADSEATVAANEHECSNT